jgi:hypothetical protein
MYEKHLFNVILTLILNCDVTAQEIEITTEKSKELNWFAQSIRNVENFFSDEPSPIYIRVFECGTMVGSLPEGLDVLYYDFYVSVKQATEDNPNGEYGWFWVNGNRRNSFVCSFNF